jgi:hypothetical protein
MEVPPNDLFSLFSCTKHEISKICSDSGDAAINLKSSFRVAFWRISAFFLTATQTTRVVQKNYGK